MPWHAKQYGGWTASDAEGLDNAHMIFDLCVSDGWTKPAIAAMMGNGAGESGLNPWRWESDIILSSTDYSGMQSYNHGYGLFQFTPSSKYLLDSYAQSLTGFAPNFSDISGNASDGNAQMLFALNLFPNDWLYTYSYYASDFSAIGIDITPFYISFDDFKAGNTSLDNLVGAFELRWERPSASAAASSYNHRLSEAQSWLNIIQNWQGGGGSGSFDYGLAWLLLKKKHRWWRR